ncbi:putative MFS sugar transporter [Aaosphaeria arxii CBS 175.79]|uniref:Putative MFS sugar transporter n=1 Tax=Aaosphaeria arxii CBS 175.79 TaxID=1450172 RepID=A0A6A5XVM0_9PLEO|nr:putative MFS sugar transporter [Aaosphaeria arxii CBS 175.79]KAF2016999.1 putative MFS sugar transporter [Aaosphaeria arxii CBS 175.79]
MADRRSSPTLQDATHRPSVIVSAAERARRNMNAKLANPLQDYTYGELRKMGRAYAYEHAIAEKDDVRAFEIGACLARDAEDLSRAKELGITDEEFEVLEKENTHRWSQPFTLYLVILLCSTCAAVQGMDETVVNGAQLFFLGQFGIGGTEPHSTWLAGLVNGAPYMCCAFVGCWLTTPFNNWFGRRGTIFITCLFSAIACFWQGFVNTWWHMFIARFALGFGIGPKSATVPIYAAECAPPAIRGALVMQWQMWTAFGIMLGYASDLAFYTVPDKPGIVGLNWRLMMGSAMLPAVIVCIFVFSCPESPRWYMSKGRHASAFGAMTKLRYNKIQAARDLFYMAELLKAEENMKMGQSMVKELYTVPRNRRALLASEIVMFMQQFCGVNVIAYYSSSIFVESGFDNQSALAASLGFGVINFLFAIPAIYTIDTFGRRNLLLTTFPLMALTLLFTGFSFYIREGSTARVACIALGIYLFGIVYSPGEGPVPFTYSAEAYPLYVRTIGMSLATATTWFFNFVLSITWPSLVSSFRPQGAFGWYAAWNVVGWVAVLLFMPETKGKTLEELDQIFSVPTHIHARYGLRQIPYFFKRYILWQNVEPEKLYERDVVGERGNEDEMQVV